MQSYKILKLRISPELFKRLGKASDKYNMPLNEFLNIKLFDLAEEIEGDAFFSDDERVNRDE